MMNTRKHFRVFLPLLLSGVMIVALAGCRHTVEECVNDTTDLDEIGLNYGANKRIEGTAYDTTLSVRCHNGIFVGTRAGGVRAWRGVPFAKVPVGERRFKAPEAADSSTLVFEAYHYGKKPISQTYLEPIGPEHGEDCLNLNVFTGDDGKKGKPVMVWIHGGAFLVESAGNAYYRGDKFAQAHPDVVLVTIDYRLGLFGFADFEGIDGSEAFRGSANNGLLDQIMALRWVRDNIEGFGGDKDNVTIFGESAGGISVALLPIIDEAKGLFQKAIIQSGSAGNVAPRGYNRQAARQLCEALKANSMADLQRVDISDLVSHLCDCGLMGMPYWPLPVADDGLIPADPYQAYADGKAQGVKIMAGYTADECRYFLSWVKPQGGESAEATFGRWMGYCYERMKERMQPNHREIADQYIAASGKNEGYAIADLMTEVGFGIGTRQLATLSSRHSDTYLYHFAYPAMPLPQGASHTAEVPLLFHKDFPFINKGANYESLLRHLGEVWVSFAKSGVPTIDGVAVPKYDEVSRTVILFDEEGNTRLCPHLFDDREQQLLPLLRYERDALQLNFAPLSQSFPDYGL